MMESLIRDHTGNIICMFICISIIISSYMHIRNIFGVRIVKFLTPEAFIYAGEWILIWVFEIYDDLW
jgi:hypothetical protein